MIPLARGAPPVYVSAMADAVLENQVACRDDATASGKACATAAGAAVWSSSKTRTPPRSISPTSAAGCWTATPAAAAITTTAPRGSTTACGSRRKTWPRSTGSRRPAPIACSTPAATSTGGTRSSRGDPESVHAAGISVRGRVAADEDALPEEKLSDHIVSWPRKWPKGSRNAMEPGTGRPRARRDKIVNFLRNALRAAVL